VNKLLLFVNGFVWGAPALTGILGVGLYLTVRLKAVQLRLLPKALKQLITEPDSENGEISPAQALCTALAATVGTGNLVGVAGAVCLGGPGAVFWMWVCGFLGMAVKYTETVLAIRYREQTSEGYVGGPMYVMIRGLGEPFRPMARLYCVFGILAAFGVGNSVQINSAVAGIRGILDPFGIDLTGTGKLLIGLMLAAVIGSVLFGGAKRIGTAAERIVPAAAGGYIALCVLILILKAEQIPDAFRAVFLGAFSPKAVTGGMIGGAFQALRIGCSRGVFTNEAGMGTASIAYACANTSHPAKQGMLGLLEVFLDTIVICTMTALAILVSGVRIPYGMDAGALMTAEAFSGVLGVWASAAVGLFLVLFALATVLGWGLYGARCAQFLFGKKAWKWFCAGQIPVIVLSAMGDSAVLWQLSETVNGLMAIPNLITLALLTPEAARITIDYIKSDKKEVSGGTYANFHQRKPLRTLSYEKVPPSGRGCQERGQEDLSPEHRSA